MMDGRVKTLHPKIHGGILGRRALDGAVMEGHGIKPIDLVAVNLYPFAATVAKPGCTLEEAIENIDIGGPTMVRSAAKNYRFVSIVTDPADYPKILEEMKKAGGEVSEATNFALSTKAFQLTARYDAAISNWVGTIEPGDKKKDFPDVYTLQFQKAQDLRYGENPHQDAAFYRFIDAQEHTLARATQVQGKELSYNNILDTDSCWTAAREFTEPCCVIVKHTNPCGLAIAADLVTAYARAYEADPVSAYGGVMAFNQIVTVDVVQAMFENKHFVEVMIAPDYEPAALELLDEKRNLRVLRTGGIRPTGGHYESRAVEGGMLVQTSDSVDEDPSRFRVATIAKPTDAEMEQLLFAWKVAKSVKSNAIVLTKDFATIGVGAGQMNRVNSARIAVEAAGEKARDSVCASDAFMPFPDTLEVCAEAGVTAFIQPGGSIRDDEVIAAANRLGVSMIFTGHRHFRH
jgi:phosphoribosylaminoimidazolecarboxamide formyltransferase/IMP cyclohydrolase